MVSKYKFIATLYAIRFLSLKFVILKDPPLNVLEVAGSLTSVISIGASGGTSTSMGVSVPDTVAGIVWALSGAFLSTAKTSAGNPGEELAIGDTLSPPGKISLPVPQNTVLPQDVLLQLLAKGGAVLWPQQHPPCVQLPLQPSHWKPELSWHEQVAVKLPELHSPQGRLSVQSDMPILAKPMDRLTMINNRNVAIMYPFICFMGRGTTTRSGYHLA
jgi:hypothetical protein